MNKWLLVILMFVSQSVLSADINTYLRQYAGENNIELVKKVLEKGADVNTSFKSGKTLVASLIIDLNFEMAEFLIDKGAEIPSKGGV